MRKYLTLYRKYILTQLEKDSCDWEKLAAEHLVKVQFFQHERLIHLIVTVLFALMTLGTVIAFVITESIGLLVLALLFIVLTVPYIRHYYFLENQTQELYKDYDRILEKINKQNQNHH